MIIYKEKYPLLEKRTYFITGDRSKLDEKTMNLLKNLFL